MSERYLVLADGTELDRCECGYSQGTLVCWLPSDMDLRIAFDAFSDPAKTSHIVFHYGSMQTEYDGYTELCSLHRDYDRQIVIFLQRGGD